MLVGLGPLVRPDLAVVSVVVAVAVLWSRRPRGAELGWLVAGFLALPVGYEIFRAGYYGALVPNTALAKDSGGMYWSQGWNYLVDLVVPYWLWVPLLVIVATAVLIAWANGPRPELVRMLALPIGGALHALFIVESGGDYLHARLLLPSLFAIVAPFAVLPWRPQFRLPLAVIGVWAFVAIAFLRPSLHQQIVPLTDYDVVDGRTLMSDLTKPGHRPMLATDFAFDDGLRAKRLEERGARGAGDAGDRRSPTPRPPRTTLVTSASGISGYRAGPEVLVQEVNSLGDPVGSRMPPTPLSKPGHRKREEWPWILALDDAARRRRRTRRARPRTDRLPRAAAATGGGRGRAPRVALRRARRGARRHPGPAHRRPLLVEPHRRDRPHPTRCAPRPVRRRTQICGP